MACSLRHIISASCVGVLLARGLFPGGHSAIASEIARGGHIDGELMAGQAAVAEGGDILIGVKLMPAKGWHSYWLNPGEVGLAPKVTWTLPQGVTAGPLQWPVPDRFIDAGVTTYGYAHESLLLVRLHNGSGLKAGSVLPLKAHVDVLVCEKLCVPESFDLSLDIMLRCRGGSG